MPGDWTCPVARAARVLGDECVLLILRDLAAGPRHFGDLLGSACGNTRTLSARLRRLTALGALERCTLPGRPPRVQYALTPMGRDLLPALDTLREFGRRWLPEGCDPLAQAPPPAHAPALDSAGAPARRARVPAPARSRRSGAAGPPRAGEGTPPAAHAATRGTVAAAAPPGSRRDA